MMELLVIAAKYDWFRLKGYLKKNTAVKVIVMIGFGITFWGLGCSLYFIAKQTAWYLTPTLDEAVSQTLRQYLNQGLSWLFLAGVVTGWFSLKTSFGRQSDWKAWLTKPIEPRQIYKMVYYRLLMGSMSLSLGLTSLILMAFLDAGAIGFDTFWRGLGVIGVITGLSIMTASLFYLQGNGLIILGLVIVSLVAFRFQGLIWGLALVLLYPLGNRVVNYYLTQRLWIKRWLNNEIRNDHGLKRPVKHLFYSPDLSITIMYQDFLSLVRNPTEIKYLIMLLSMGGIFYLTLNAMPMNQFQDEGLKRLIQVILGGAIGYLMTTWAGRFIYPLMSKRAPWLWLVLTSPVPRIELLDSKLGVSLGLTLPWIWLAILTASKLMIDPREWSLFSWFLITTVIAIGSFQALAGIIWPAFKLAKHPDQVTTNYGGMMAVSGSLLITSGGMLSWYGERNWGWSQAQWGFWGVLIFGIILFLMKAIRSVKLINR